MSETIHVLVNGTPQQLAAGTTVAALLGQLGHNPRYWAVECNQQLIPRAEHAACVLKDADQLEIVTLVGGG